ncbi:hypothetical protein NW767_008217 [Fusarium falciforme]|nr:hypothetical protein NW767_008217 [Fusarium falciforme]
MTDAVTEFPPANTAFAIQTPVPADIAGITDEEVKAVGAPRHGADVAGGGGAEGAAKALPVVPDYVIPISAPVGAHSVASEQVDAV